MVLPKQLARFNRVITNRTLGLVADWMPGFGVVTHVGRRSGRTYTTPVNVFRTPDGFVVALTYGRGDWVRNVLAAGGCELTTRRRHHRLTGPRVVRDDSRRDVPIGVRQILAVTGVDEFLHLTEAA